MKITKEWLKEHDACKEVFEWFTKQKESDCEKIIKMLMEEDNFDWANWLITEALKIENKIKYAIYAAELVLHIFENKYPDDDRPRKAIESAKKYLGEKSIHPTRGAFTAAARAADAAAAAFAAFAAFAAADAFSAGFAAAADAAAFAAANAAAADAAANADAFYADAADAADAFYADAADAFYADADAADDIKQKVINFGITLLKEEI